MNNEILRLAIVINTSHSTFLDNLSNVLIYILYTNRENKSAMSKDELQNDIKDKLYLEFTEKEIQLAMNQVIEKNLVNTLTNKISLNEMGLKKINRDNESNFELYIKEYKQQFEIKYSVDQIRNLILKYLYCYINENIEIIESMINGHDGKTKIDECYCDELLQYTDDEREIVNNFLDWPNTEKDKLINKFLYFAVDYCRLTVKKDNSNFNDILKGKKFYLDTNIIFRLMGLNGEKRKKVTTDFIDKCKEVNIKLLYTNVTKKETFESIKFHANRIKELQNNLHVREQKIHKLMEASNYSDGFIEKYYSWSIKNNSFGKFGDFVKYLQSEFYHCVKSFEMEVYERSEKQDIKINDMTKRLMQFKRNNTSEMNAAYDVQNIIHVENKRRQSGAQISWNISQYLISADHNLVAWTNDEYKEGVPIVVLPSVWYSMILKITGRTSEGFKSFVEFIKLKYIQHDNNDVLSSLITCIRNRTDNGLLQEMIIDEIVDNNIINNSIQNAEYEAIKDIVDEIYDNSIESTRKKGYEDGYQNGIKEGKNSGIEYGIKAGRDDGMSKGIELGEKKAKIALQIETIEEEIKDKINKRKNHKKILKYLFLPVCVFICIILCYIIYIYTNITGGMVSIAVSVVFNVIINMYVAPIMNKTNEAIMEEERKNRDTEVENLKDQLRQVTAEIKSITDPA